MTTHTNCYPHKEHVQRRDWCHHHVTQELRLGTSWENIAAGRTKTPNAWGWLIGPCGCGSDHFDIDPEWLRQDYAAWLDELNALTGEKRGVTRATAEIIRTSTNQPVPATKRHALH